MYIIAGLGNPEKKYENTRHNIGFDVIDALSAQYSIEIKEKAFRALMGKGVIEGQKVILAKPQTYMNLSGESIRQIIDYFKVDVENELIVVSDDIALAEGNIRIRKKGSAGGHNGLKNIILNLGTENFQRVRLGVGEKPAERDLVDYVLGHFSKEERSLMEEGIKKAVEAIGIMLVDGPDRAMNLFNKKMKIAESDGNENGNIESSAAGAGGI